MDQKKEKIRVIVIDASAVTRYILGDILEQSGDIKVVASLHNPAEALNKILTLKPHVITLDTTMQGMNSLAFLEKVREYQPTPVVIISAADRQSDFVTRAMELGAVNYAWKQYSQSWSGILSMADEIVEKVKTAAAIQLPGSVNPFDQGAGRNL